jgi:hypothetical protein
MAIDQNIKIRKENFTVKDGYFYTFDEDQDALLQKTDDGNTAFSYPCDTILENEITSLEFDGIYLWSLETTTDPDGISIKKWKIDNYICKLQEQFDKTGGGHTYEAACFSIEHYHTSLSSALVGGETVIYLDKYYNQHLVTDNNTILHLGPNTSGEEEDVIINGTVLGGVTLTSPIQYIYDIGDLVNFHKNIYVFNNYSGTDDSTGSLYKFDSETGNYITRYDGGAYKDVLATTFSTISSFTEFGDVDTLMYTKGTNALFVDTSPETKTYYDADTVNDNFTGTNGSVPDTDLWEITSGTPTIQTNQLQLNVNNTSEIIKSKYYLPDDFDVSIYGNLDNYPSGYSGTDYFYNAITLNFPYENNRYCKILRGYNNEFGNATHENQNFASISRTATDEVLASGVATGVTEYWLRMKRVSDDVFFYYKTVELDPWTPLGTKEMYTTAAELIIETTDTTSSSVVTYNDDVVFSEGEIIYTTSAIAFPYYGSMVMDNVKDDGFTIDSVVDLSIDRNNMYRLHYVSGNYSYALSPLESFVTSISISASPAVIAANGISTSSIKAVVKDQFLQPIVGRRVTFSENGDGDITGEIQINTNDLGEVETTYQSGTNAQKVQFTAVVEQTS